MSNELEISTVLTIVFVILKLVGVISWSWVWVLSPFWIMVLFDIVVAVILYFIDR